MKSESIDAVSVFVISLGPLFEEEVRAKTGCLRRTVGGHYCRSRGLKMHIQTHIKKWCDVKKAAIGRWEGLKVPEGGHRSNGYTHQVLYKKIGSIQSKDNGPDCR